MKILELSPAPHEVAVARIPAGVSVLVPGHPSVPRAGKARYAAVPGAALGWGAYVCTWGSAAGIAYHHHRRDRAVWQHAAKMLAREILHDDSMAVLYVVHEQAEEHGKPVWAAVRIRQENRA